MCCVVTEIATQNVSDHFFIRCGFRGGYCEVVNFDERLKAALNNCLDVKLCAPMTAQLVVDCVFNPPKPGAPSYEKFQQVFGVLLVNWTD